MSALVAEIQRLPCEDKCLVFSEWDEVRTPRFSAQQVVQLAYHPLVRRCFAHGHGLRQGLCICVDGLQMLDVVEAALKANHVR